jgi:hypothetical protein
MYMTHMDAPVHAPVVEILPLVRQVCIALQAATAANHGNSVRKVRSCADPTLT